MAILIYFCSVMIDVDLSKPKDSNGQIIDVSLDEHQLAEKILSNGLQSPQELQKLKKHLPPGHLAIQIAYDLLSAGLLTQGSKLPLKDYPRHNISHIFQTIQDNQAIFKIIKSHNWADFVKQIENYNYRPALRTQKPHSSQALFKYVHSTKKTIPYVPQKRNPHKVYTHTKKQAATYLSKNLHTKVFGEQHPDEPLVGLLFDERLCMTKAMFRYDRGTYPREWVGSKQAVQSYAKRLQQEKLLFSSRDKFRADIDNNPTLNEALVKFSRESILAIFVASDTPKAKEEARQRQEELFRKFGKRYEIIFYDNKKNTVKIYSTYQRILDVTGIDILKNPEIFSQYQELISGTLHLENQQKLTNETILLAMFFNNSHALQKLLEYPIDINLKNQYGDTALIWAAEKGHTEIVEQLLAKGANANIKNNNGETALIWAAYNGHTAIVEQLLAKGADVNIQGQNGNTALIWAASKGHTAIVEQLLEHNADVNIEDQNGKTALSHAIENRHINTITRLLIAGAKLNIPLPDKDPLLFKLLQSIIKYQDLDYRNRIKDLIEVISVAGTTSQLKLCALQAFQNAGFKRDYLSLSLELVSGIFIVFRILQIMADLIQGLPAFQLMLMTSTQRAVFLKIQDLSKTTQSDNSSLKV